MAGSQPFSHKSHTIFLTNFAMPAHSLGSAHRKCYTMLHSCSPLLVSSWQFISVWLRLTRSMTDRPCVDVKAGQCCHNIFISPFCRPGIALHRRSARKTLDIAEPPHEQPWHLLRGVTACSRSQWWQSLQQNVFCENMLKTSCSQKFEYD